MNIETLKLLDLNAYEAKIYLALVQYPGATAAEIAKHSRVPQNRVYDTVEQLISKKFAYLVPGNPKRYAPEDPKILRKLIQEKAEKLKQLDKEFISLEENFKIINTQKVLVSRTARNFDNIFDSIPLAKEFSYSIQPKLSLLPRHLKRAHEMKKENVKQRSITDVSMKDSTNLKKWLKFQENFTFMETKNIAMNINESGVLISLIPPENESLIIYIESKNLAYVMKEMYEGYWNQLKSK